MKAISLAVTSNAAETTMTPAEWTRVTESLIAYSRAVEESREGSREEPTPSTDK